VRTLWPRVPVLRVEFGSLPTWSDFPHGATFPTERLSPRANRRFQCCELEFGSLPTCARCLLAWRTKHGRSVNHCYWNFQPAPACFGAGPPGVLGPGAVGLYLLQPVGDQCARVRLDHREVPREKKKDCLSARLMDSRKASLVCSVAFELIAQLLPSHQRG